MKYICTGLLGHCMPHLAKLLLKEGHELHAIVRETSGRTTDILDVLTSEEFNKIKFHYGDFTDYRTIEKIFKENKFDGLFHLGAQSVIEDELIPIKTSKKINYYSFKELWNNFKKHNSIQEIDVDGTKTEVIEIKGNQNKALSFSHGMGQWNTITHITRHKWNGEVVKLKSKYGSVTVTPNHCVYDYDGKLTSAENIKECLPIRKINYLSGKYKNIIKIKNKILRGNDLKNFLAFCGAYIAEGYAGSYNRKNRPSLEYIVSISNNDLKWLETLKKQIKSVFPDLKGYIDTSRKCNQLCFKNKNLFLIMKKSCGDKSENKKIPTEVFYLDNEYKEILLNNMKKGDGCSRKHKYSNTYHYATISKKLACQTSLLHTLLNKDYVTEICYEKHDIYQPGYRIKETKHYQLNQGKGLIKEKYIYNGYVYDITVEGAHNFAAGFGNILVHNSHPPTSFKDPFSALNANIIGTFNLIEAIRLYNSECVMCNVSTSETYGDMGKDVGILKEDMQEFPANPYGWSKLCAEKYLRERCKNGFVKGFSTRAFSHFAERRGKNFSISCDAYYLALMKTGNMESRELPVGNLNTERVVISAKDVVRAYYELMKKYQSFAEDELKQWNGESFNVCGDIKNVKKMEYFTDKLIEISGLNNVKKVIDPRFYRPIDIQIQVGDTTKLKSLINWKPEINIDNQLRELFNYWMKKLK